MIPHKKSKAMGNMAGGDKPDTEMETLQRQYAQARKGLAARSGESLRQGNVLQQRAAYQAGGLGGAGLKMAQKHQAEIQRGIAGEEAGVGVAEAQQTGQLLGQRAEREFMAGEAEKGREFEAGEAEKGRAWEQKQRDWENTLNSTIANWNMTQTEMNDRFNRFVTAKKEGLRTPDDWAKLMTGMQDFEGGFDRKIKPFPGATTADEWRERYEREKMLRRF